MIIVGRNHAYLIPLRALLSGGGWAGLTAWLAVNPTRGIMAAATLAAIPFARHLTRAERYPLPR